jgi:hypothetical protein
MVINTIFHTAFIFAAFFYIYRKIKADAEANNILGPDHWAWAAVISPYIILPIYTISRMAFLEDTASQSDNSHVIPIAFTPYLLLLLSMPLVAAFISFNGATLILSILLIYTSGLIFLYVTLRK